MDSSSYRLVRHTGVTACLTQPSGKTAANGALGCNIVWLAVAVGALLSSAITAPVVAQSAAQQTTPARGSICGRVLDAATNEPIAGAYVGTGDFGDSGGSNYTRHRDKGYHASTYTDDKGRFELHGLAFVEDDPWLESHPLVVTHSQYVRHDEQVLLSKDRPTPQVDIRLRKAAQIEVQITDPDGGNATGTWLCRLERTDGRLLLHPGQDRHLSSFASAAWTQRSNLRNAGSSAGFSFTELDSGEYRLGIFDMAPASRINQSWTSHSKLTYYGGINAVNVLAGESKEITVQPSVHNTRLLIRLPADPINKPEIPSMILISRNTGLPAWDTDRIYALEDARLGRLQKQSLFFSPVAGESFVFDNFPPARYIIFAGPVILMNSVEVEAAAGRTAEVTIPPVTIADVTMVGVHRFDRQIELDEGLYSAGRLCELITEITQSSPVIHCDPAIRDRTVNLKADSIIIWDLIERLFADKRWRLVETGDDKLTLRSQSEQ